MVYRLTVLDVFMYEEAACAPRWYVLSFRNSLNVVNGRTGHLNAR